MLLPFVLSLSKDFISDSYKSQMPMNKGAAAPYYSINRIGINRNGHHRRGARDC